MSSCSCPLGVSIPSVPNASCPQDFGQVQKVIFQRIFSSGTTKNTMTTANAKLLASWQALFAAADGTKAVITPYVEAPASDGGDAITFGGGNETIGGVTKVIGRNPVTMAFALRQYEQSIIASLKELQCELALGVYLINGEGQIMGISGGENAIAPIPISAFFVGDLKLNGLETPDDNAMSWSFKPNWSDTATIVTPTDFNAVTDLANA